MTEPRKLRVFLCHSSQDKPIVRELYRRLLAEGWIDPWLDEEKLLPGQDWEMAIEKAVRSSDAAIVLLSSNSVTKEGFLQKELRFVLGVADYMPEDRIFLIPIRLDDCIVPRRLLQWQHVDYFPKGQEEKAYQRLAESLRLNFLQISEGTIIPSVSPPRVQVPRFISIPLGLARQPNGEKVPGVEAYRNLGLEPGSHTFNDIPFHYEFELFTQNSNSPNSPQLIIISFRIVNPVCLYFIMQADWGVKKYRGAQVGKIVVKFETSESFEYPLILGNNIRDWSRGSSSIAVDTVSSPDVTNAWTGYAPDGKKGGMDLLTIDLPVQFHAKVLSSINIVDTTLDTTGDYNPGIHLLAASAKFLEDV